jgi:electron transport complex protein RnfG
MSDVPMIGQAPPTSVWQMYRSMVGIGLLCGLLIVVAFDLTKPVIERNKAEALQRAIFQVLPEARSSSTFRLSGDAGFEASDGKADGERLVYAGYDDAGTLVGVAIEAQGMGYQGVIRVLYGYSFEAEAIIGIRVLESKETPGLGTKIETDPAFLANFERLDVSLDADGAAVANPIEGVKHGAKDRPWQIDGVTGATISSMAIAKLLRESTVWWIPRIRRDADDFRKAG